MTDVEFDMILSSLAGESGDLALAIRKTEVGEVDAMWFSCVVRSLLAKGFEREHVGRLCGAYLMEKYGPFGSLTQADPAVVEALRAMMADWPVLEDSWWAGVWQGMPIEELNAALNVRLALYEALALVEAEQEWIDRLRFLAKQENDALPGHTLALLSLGQCLGRRLPITVYADVVRQARDSTWMKALIYGFPDEMRWPATGYLSMPESLYQDFGRLLSSDEYRWKNELTMHQWEILGPVVAVENLESFYLESDPLDPGWNEAAAAQVYSVLRALSWPSVPEGDVAYLVTARALVRDLMVSNDPHDVTRVFDVLQGSFQLSVENRALLVEVLGPDVVSMLPPDIRAWLSI